MSNNPSNVWGKLISVNSNLQNVNLINKAYKIGRNQNNDVAISDVRVSGTHCIVTQGENGTVILQDLSSNGSFIGDNKIGKGKSKLLSSGDKFYLLPVSKIPEKQLLGYIFTANVPDQNSNKRPREMQEETNSNRNNPNKQIKTPEKIEEEISKPECGLCTFVIYQCVTTIPCQHNFCGACYTESAGSLPTCPACFGEVTELKRNEAIDQQANLYLERNPRSKRSADELKRMNNDNKYKNGHFFSKEPEAGKTKQAQEFGQQRNNSNNEYNNQGNMAIEAPPNEMTSKIQRYYNLMSRFTAE